MRYLLATGCLLFWLGSLSIASTGSQSSTGGKDSPSADGKSERKQQTLSGRTSVPTQNYVITVEERAVDVPRPVYLVEEDNIRHRLISRSVPEILKEIPGVLGQKTAHGQGSPFIRGFTGYRTVFLIDGIRLNNSVFRDGPNQYWNVIDPYLIQQLEVIKGPNSVRFGSDAVGGTVNLVTRSKQALGRDSKVSGRFITRFATAERSYIGRVEAGAQATQRLSVLAGVSSKNFGDLRAAGLGRQPRTGYDELDGDLKLEFLINKDSKLTFAHQQVSQDDVWRTHKTIFGVPWQGTAVGTEKRRVLDQSRSLSYLQFHATGIGNLFNRLRLSLSHHSLEERSFRVRSNDRSDQQGFDVGTLGLWAQFESPTPIGELTYGLEYYRDEVDSFRRDFNSDGTLRRIRVQGPVADASNYQTLGLYAENRFQLAETVTLLLGGRSTHAGVRADRVEDPRTGEPLTLQDSWNQLVGSARAIFDLDSGNHMKFFTGVSQAFRAPNLSDLTRFDTARSSEIETPSFDLEPEKMVAYEAGFKATKANFDTQLAYFLTDIRRMIVRTPTGRTVEGLAEVTKKNSGDGYVHGIEAAARFYFHPQWLVSASFASMYGELDTFPTSEPVAVREPLSRLLPTGGLVGVDWTSVDTKVSLGFTTRFSSAQTRLSTRDRSDTQRIPPGGTPGYAVLDVYGSWRPSQIVSLSARLENILDEEYRIHGSGLNEPGRNFVIGLELGYEK